MTDGHVLDEDPERARSLSEGFCIAHWDVLAAAAWRYFQRHGRGALLLDWAVIQDWALGQAWHSYLAYATDLGNETVESLVSGYDPARQIVVVITTDTEATLAPFAAGGSVIARLTGTFGAWIVNGATAPPEAHRRQRGDRRQP